MVQQAVGVFGDGLWESKSIFGKEEEGIYLTALFSRKDVNGFVKEEMVFVVFAQPDIEGKMSFLAHFVRLEIIVQVNYFLSIKFSYHCDCLLNY